jgi:hypothetical protein
MALYPPPLGCWELRHGLLAASVDAAQMIAQRDSTGLYIDWFERSADFSGEGVTRSGAIKALAAHALRVNPRASGCASD